MKILIVSSAHLSRNPRVLKEAHTLGSAGHDVTVLNVRIHRPADEFDREILAAAPFKRVVAVDDLDHLLTGFLRRGLVRLAREAQGRFGVESAWSLGPAGAWWRAARRFPADLTITHIEPALWAGARLLDEGRRVAADFEDWYSENLPEEQRRHLPLEHIRTNEAAMLSRGAFTTAPSLAMAKALAAQYGEKPPAVIYNAFPLQPAAKTRFGSAGAPPSGAPRVLWCSHTVGPGRGLETAVEALALTRRKWQLHLLGAARLGYVERLSARLPEEARTRLFRHDFVAPQDLPGKIAGFDLGLALEPGDSPNNDLTISNKVLQYFNAGLGVIATATAGQREALAHSPGAGRLVATNSAPALAAILDEILESPGMIPSLGRAARAAAEKTFCWEHEAPKLLALVESGANRQALPVAP